MAIPDWMAALALINGTAGGIVLVLPIIGLDAGWLMIPIIILISSLSCFYTAVVMFRHLGKHNTINDMILSHFNSPKYCYFYNITMFLSFGGQMLLYYDLLVSETQGIFHFLSQNVRHYFPFYCAIFLMILALVSRYFHFQDQLLGYGILSMIAFSVFIAYIIIDRQKGIKQIPPVNSTFIDLGATMSQGYSIHNMMIPVILRAQNPQNYKKILGISLVLFQANVFIFAGLLYTFISYGSFALVNRQPIPGSDGETVQDYFSANEWEIYLLRGIYIINIVTVFPQFLSISRIRFFNIFSKQQPRQSPISLKEIIYYVVIIGTCLLAKILKLRAATIIELNGAIICFMEIYLIPLGIHLKFIWLDWPQTLQSTHMHHKIKHSENRDHIVNENHMQSLEMQNVEEMYHKKVQQLETQTLQHKTCICHQDFTDKNNNQRINQIGVSFIILGWGVFVMFYTLITVFFQKEPTPTSP